MIADQELEYRTAITKCLVRYATMAHNAGISDLNDFMIEFALKVEEFPIPKLCRWLGFIQGVLTERRVTTVEAERNWTRPLFRHLDFD